MNNRVVAASWGIGNTTVAHNQGSRVISPCRYEPEANPTYQDLAPHYNTAVLPA